jgi:hypothetical protein
VGGSTPVNLAIQEAEIKRIASKQAQANSSQDPVWKIPNTKKDWWSGSSGKMPT